MRDAEQEPRLPDQKTPQDQDQSPELPLDGIALPPSTGVTASRSASIDRDDAFDPDTASTATSEDADPSLGDTVGTGTVIALACIAATIFLIVLGLIYVLIARFLG
jgi:hypothetical protein